MLCGSVARTLKNQYKSPKDDESLRAWSTFFCVRSVHHLSSWLIPHSKKGQYYVNPRLGEEKCHTQLKEAPGTCLARRDGRSTSRVCTSSVLGVMRHVTRELYWYNSSLSLFPFSMTLAASQWTMMFERASIYLRGMEMMTASDWIKGTYDLCSTNCVNSTTAVDDAPLRFLGHQGLWDL